MTTAVPYSVSSPIRILIADDHLVVLEGLVAILQTQPDFEVVAQATGGKECVHKFKAHQPDLVLLDLEMPDLDGVATLKSLQVIDPAVRAIVFTAFDTDERVFSINRGKGMGIRLEARLGG